MFQKKSEHFQVPKTKAQIYTAVSDFGPHRTHSTDGKRVI